MGTKQLVVHEALDTTKSLAGSNSSSLTPTTKVASTPVAGAEMMTRVAPASRWAAADLPGGEQAGRLDDHVDAELVPREGLGIPLGQHGDGTGVEHDGCEPSTVTSLPNRPWVESYRSRWARVSAEVRSLMATTSTSAPRQPGRPEVVPADAPEPVDADPYRHCLCASPFTSCTCLAVTDRTCTLVPVLPPLRRTENRDHARASRRS